MKTYPRQWLESPNAPVCDPVALEWRNDTPQVKYLSWSQASYWLMLRAATQDMMSRMLMLEVSDGDDLRNAALELFRIAIIYMVETEIDGELAVAVEEWLNLQTIDDSVRIAELVKLLTANNPNRRAIELHMRDNL